MVGIVPENIAAINAANDHMLEQVGNIEADGSWHEVTITSVGNASELINNVPNCYRNASQLINNVPDSPTV
jgi:hypothetical protein